MREHGALADLEQKLLDDGYEYVGGKYSSTNILYDKQGKVRQSAHPIRDKRTRLFFKKGDAVVELHWLHHHPETKTFYVHGKRMRNVAGADTWELIKVKAKKSVMV